MGPICAPGTYDPLTFGLAAYYDSLAAAVHDGIALPPEPNRRRNALTNPFPVPSVFTGDLKNLPTFR